MQQMDALRILTENGATVRVIQGEYSAEFSFEWRRMQDYQQFEPLVTCLKDFAAPRLSIHSSARIPPDQFREIMKSIRLKTLLLVDCKQTPEFLVHLKNQTELEYLSLQSDFLSEEVIRSMAELPNLKSLYLSDGVLRYQCINEDIVSELPKLKSLKSLAVGDVRFDGQSCQAICRMTSLESLSLVGCSWPTGGFTKIEQLKDLKTMVFNSCRIDPGTANGIGNLTNISQLHFFTTDLNDESFSALTGCLTSDANKSSTLELTLSGTRITEASLDRLAKLDREYDWARIVVPDDLDVSTLRAAKPKWLITQTPRDAYPER